MNIRILSAQTIKVVAFDNRSLTKVLHEKRNQITNLKDKALYTELCFGSLRYWHQLTIFSNTLLHKPLKSKHNDVFCLLIIGLYQLLYCNIPSYAAINETVAGCITIKKPWAKGLLNKVLRLFDKNRDKYADEDNLEYVYSHPCWLIDIIKQDWPDEWENILINNNTIAPMILRLQTNQISMHDFIIKLNENDIDATTIDGFPSAVILNKHTNIEKLPGFKQGWFVVQDISGQLVAPLIQTNNFKDFKLNHSLTKGNILDCCAAPGSKTTHLASLFPNCQITAIDIDSERLQLVTENCQRLNINNVTTQAVDICDPNLNFPPLYFDYILVDAPCSGTGVIRRHPDIKLLRLKQDIKQLAEQQFEILKCTWRLLKPGGYIIYSTCSILHTENTNLIKEFLSQTTNAQHIPIATPFGRHQQFGVTFLPNEKQNDGFFICKIMKNIEE